MSIQSIGTKPMKNLNRIKVILTETGHTEKWLAGQLGKTSVTVSKWCTNKTQPHLNTLKRISEILNVDIKSLLS